MSDIALNISLSGATEAAQKAEDLTKALSVSASKNVAVTTTGADIAKSEIEALKASLDSIPSTLSYAVVAPSAPLANVKKDSQGVTTSKELAAAQRAASEEAEHAVKVQDRAREILFKLGPAGETAAKGMNSLRTAAHGTAQVTAGLSQISQGGVGAVHGLAMAWQGFNNILKGSIVGAIIAALLALVQVVKTLWETLSFSEEFHGKLKNDATAAFDAAIVSATKYAATAAEIERLKLQDHANAIRELTTRWKDSHAAVDRYAASQKALRQAQQNSRLAALDLEEQKALAAAPVKDREVVSAKFQRRRESLKTGFDKNEAELDIRDTAISRDNQSSLITAANKDWKKRSTQITEKLKKAETEYTEKKGGLSFATGGMTEDASDNEIKLRRGEIARYREDASKSFATSRTENGEAAPETQAAAAKLQELDAKLSAIDDFLAARSQYTEIGDEYTKAAAEHTRIIAEATEKVKEAETKISIQKQNRDTVATRAQVEDVRTANDIKKAQLAASGDANWKSKMNAAKDHAGDSLTKIGANFGDASASSALDYARRSADAAEGTRKELQTLNRAVATKGPGSGFTE